MLSRRQALASAASLLPFALGAQSDARPNVLFLSVDDMNDYGFHRAYPGVKMPYLDAFRKTAIRFERAYCTAPACIPSRASLFSGLHPHRTGAYRNGSDPWTKGVFPSTESLPEVFHRNGYTTFGRGKNFHAPLPKEREAAMWDNEYWGGGFGPFPPEKDQVAGQFWGTTAWEGPDEDFPDVKNARAAIEFLGQSHEKPFFLALGVWRPHTPFTAPKRFFDLYRDVEIPFPPPGYREGDLADVSDGARELAAAWGERFEISGAGNPALWQRFLRAYFATTSFADWSIGSVIEALDKSRYARNTIVVLWSDNGYHCGEKDHWEKTTLWEKSCLVPAAIRVPGSAHAGANCTRIVSLLDLYPTLIDLCGISPPKHALDGHSLRPLVENPRAPWDRAALTTYGEGLGTVRDEHYRYIVYPSGEEELYDHRSDPHEFDNLAGKAELAPARERLRKEIPKAWAPTMGGRLG
ncbi:MAG: sulfatase [Bryobacterales bacterium]|nr:sulfatase [Bryobacterales bacterium]